jgi:hypothetical protein
VPLLTGDAEFTDAWLQCCRRLYNETSAEQITETGAAFGSQNRASTRVEGQTVLKPVDEAGFSANTSARYGLAAIQCLALIGDKLPG